MQGTYFFSLSHQMHCSRLSRIIREAYLSMEVGKRPRILGMTASPVDTKCDIAEAAM
jgi:hypothetical protein